MISQDKAQALRVKVDGALLENMTRTPCPAGLRDAMAYSLLSPGKRIRPLLTFLACEACGGNPEIALPAACAIEMVHAFSLIHDDLPAMDNDELRRGKPTNHVVYGEGPAILAGDALLAQAFHTLAELPEERMIARCTAILAHATGPQGMIGGQWDDIAAMNDVSAEAILSLSARKTGALIVGAIQMGAVCANANREQEDSLTVFAQHIGLLFQVTDDLLDFNEEEEKKTYPRVFGVDEAKNVAVHLLDGAINALAPFREFGNELANVARQIYERQA